ncbi:MAG: hypothetical protein P8K08_18720 [Fuerstiella sp.]|nr:hypothetical protein [Fuerstiella sp.]
MRHLLLALLLVAMTGCGSETKQEEQPATPTETPNESDAPSAKAGVPAVNSIGMRFVPIPAGTFTMGEVDYGDAVGSKYSAELKTP